MSSFPPPPPPPRAAPRPAPAPPAPPAHVPLWRRWYGPLASPRTWTRTAHLLADLPVGIALFTVIVVGLSTGAGLAITFFGIPILMATLLSSRIIGTVERGRAKALLGVEVTAPPPIVRTGTFWQRAKAVLTDATHWKGLLYGLAMLPWGIAAFTLAVVIWTVSLSFVTAPIWAWFTDPTVDGNLIVFLGRELGGVWLGAGAVVSMLVGLLLLAAAPRLVRGLAAVDAGLVRTLLGVDPTERLTERVEQLTASRDASVEGAALELQRIERDLHDGAQQRLVALAMDLGMARERLEQGQDPARAGELVARAHDEAKAAITELRELVRGIHPQILTDRGLDAALSALAARSRVPVTVDVRLEHRPPAAIEAAAYFVVAEALANLAKHSAATRASVRVEQVGRMLMIDVRDDGRGGAIEVPGGGLAGLRDRVAAVEGTLRLTSPSGGPTEIHVELPCAS